jgi:membrane-associated protein
LLHIDRYLAQITTAYGGLTYLILFFIIFAETGFVFTPFLPGDSLLFAAGALASLGSLNITSLLLLLWLAAFLGDTVNYWIGHFFGEKIIAHPKLPLNREHLNKAQKFYDQYGGKTIFGAVYPDCPTRSFVAGIGKMDYKRFVF